MIKTLLKHALLASAMLLSAISMGQFTGNYSFPQNTTYTYGIMPSNPNHSDALAAYNSWKSEFVTSACGARRVKFDSPNGSQTVSEGIAYGMLLAAYAGDKDLMDDLWDYYNMFLNDNGVMHWKISNCSNPSNASHQNGATDAELDVAFALYVASWQWPNDNYLSDAKSMIRKIRMHEVDSQNNLNTLKPGDKFGGHHSSSFTDDLVNISYFSPAYYRVFADIDDLDGNQSAFWNQVADRGYDIMDNAMNQSTGLVPDWCTAAGNSSSLAASNGYTDNGNNFFFDAVRTPWRTSLDYLWHGTPEALTYCEKISAWVRSQGGTPAMGNKYALNGSKLDNNHSNTFVGCFGAGMMATDDFANNTFQTSMDQAYNDNKNTNPESGQYFNATLKAITLFTMTGNFYLPPPDQCDAPDLGDDVSLCNGNVTLNTGLSASGRSFTWYKDGVQQGGTGASLVVSSAGIYKVLSNEGGCIRTDQVTVYQSDIEADFNFTPSAGNTLEINFEDVSLGGPQTYSWDFGDGNTSTLANPVNGFANPGLYLVTLTTTNECNETDQKTAEVTVGTFDPNAPGWSADNFTTAQWANLWVFAETTHFTLDQTDCSILGATTLAGAGQYDNFSITLKDGANDAEIDMSGFPFVRFRMKVSGAIDSLRVDLGNGEPLYNSTGLNPVYLKGERNADGSYQPIPVNEWFVSTLDYTGRWGMWPSGQVDNTAIKQISFLPKAQYTNGSGAPLVTFEIDWIILGNTNIDPPSFTLAATASACEGDVHSVDLSNVCHVDDIQWSHGPTTGAVDLAPGDYDVTLTNFGGSTTKSITVTELGEPSAGFSAITNGLTADFTNGSTDGSSYSWTSDGTGFSSVTNPSETFGASGTYEICLTATNSCGTDEACNDVTVAVIGLDESNTLSGVSLYPTSAVADITFDFGSYDQEFEVNVFDLAGNKVLSSEVSSSNNQLNVAGLANGMYNLQLVSNGKTLSQKFVKQ